MRRRISYRLIIILFALLPSLFSSGQFYNGMQMSFGKNRVQYDNFSWTYFRFDNFDCYYNEYGKDVAQFACKVAKEKLEQIEDYFDYSLDKRLILVVYNKKNDFRQSNIGLVSTEDDYNVGGYTRIIKNKISLYFNGDHEEFAKQIAAAIAEVVVYEMVYNADTHDKVSSTSEINFPEWYIKGLVNYVAFGWDSETDNRVRDAFLNGKYKNLDNLEYDDAIFAGQSFWKYIGEKYGNSIIPNIIYLSKVYKNVEDGFLYGLGESIKDTYKGWKAYYANYYQVNAGDNGNQLPQVKKARVQQHYTAVKVSPDGKLIAWVSNSWGKRKIWIYDTERDKNRLVFSAEPKFDQSVDYTYPVIAWHPGGRVLTFMNESKGGVKLWFYRMDDHSLESRDMPFFEKVMSMEYSPDGSQLLLVAVNSGMTDIYLHTIISGINERLTFDIADDREASFVRGKNNTIIFSSNRLTDILTNKGDPLEETALTYSLFTYNIATRGTELTRLSENPYNNYRNSILPTSNSTGFLSNQNGIVNFYKSKYDSTISYIDTTSHYRHFIESYPVTNYSRNIEAFDKNNQKEAAVIFDKGRYRLLAGTADNEAPVKIYDIVVTNFRKEEIKRIHIADSISQVRSWLLEEQRKMHDTLKKPLYEYYAKNEPIDINNYIFEKEKENYYELQWRKNYLDIDLDTSRMKFPSARVYRTAFYNNYSASQIDFNFLNYSYQAYNGGSSYFNPGLNMLYKIGAIDLFEDFRITGGFRFSGNFDSNEYLVSLEALKGKFDKQYIFHQQTFNTSNDTSYYKIKSYSNYFSLLKPLSNVLCLKGTLIYRLDNYITQSIDPATLTAANEKRQWVGLKGELIFDNTRKRMINIYYGTRFKVFGEYYHEFVSNNRNMYVIGADIRHYQKIHRELIWANRFAASGSFGSSKLIYFLGGVDNWMGYLFNTQEMFDTSVPVNPNARYGFQALATNLRGFSQNIRNGSNFALINSEVRWPVVRYFVGHPLRSNFLNSIQVVGFGDAGMAWTGWNPWGDENYWDTSTYENGSVVVHLDTNREPLVMGFGFGARAQILGYFIRGDVAWGVENGYVLPRIFYLSFSLDF
jgi:Tol biopolymer transport system component